MCLVSIRSSDRSGQGGAAYDVNLHSIGVKCPMIGTLIGDTRINVVQRREFATVEKIESLYFVGKGAD